MLKFSIILFLTALFAAAGAIYLIYNPASRTTGGFVMYGLTVVGLVLILLGIYFKIKRNRTGAGER
jgi:LPXTG-motif cell wall-anchored protein